MCKTFAETHKFCRGTVPGDGKCLYWSFLLGIRPHLIETLRNISFQPDLKNALNDSNEDLRLRVAKYIREHTELHDLVLAEDEDEEYETIEEYCSAVERGELWGGDVEKKVLSTLFNILICEISPGITRAGKCLNLRYYGEDNPLATECIYIYYNGEDHFDPLYVVEMENSNNKQTIFDPNDQMVNNILRKFIKEELGRN
jgi:hypothetical protein